jgi:flavodoxin
MYEGRYIMKRVLIIYYSLTGITEKMAEYIGEGIRISGHEAVVKKTSDITNREDIRGFDGYIFGSPTHHRDIAAQMKDFLLVPRREDLRGKLAGSFGSYTHDGNAPAIILETMEHVFKMQPSELGPFNLLETIMETNEGLRACHDYGRVFGEELG